MNKVTREYLECVCCSPDHLFQMCLHDEYNGEEPILYTEVQLRQYRRWYKRLWIAVKYFFGYQCRYGHWDCFSFERETAVQMRDMLNRYLEKLDRYERAPRPGD